MSSFLTIYPGWNVWAVWQSRDLDFSLMNVGLSPERQLRIWVEDSVRLGAPGAIVADPIDLKGGQVEVINTVPGLPIDKRKESVPGPAMLIKGPADLHFVRFYNRGQQTSMNWPHNSNYLLSHTYKPQKDSPVTPPNEPPTIGGNIGSGIVETGISSLSGVALGIGAVLAAFYLLKKS